MTANDLAAQVKAWRGKVSCRDAAAQIGLPWRTLEWVEQGHGFRYPELLRIAMQTIDPNGGKDAQDQNAAS